LSIVERIRALGGEVGRDRWNISLRKGRLDATALAWIAKHRGQLMREIWPEYDAFEERAAIIEYDGGLPRQEAERAAYREVCGC